MPEAKSKLLAGRSLRCGASRTRGAEGARSVPGAHGSAVRGATYHLLQSQAASWCSLSAGCGAWGPDADESQSLCRGDQPGAPRLQPGEDLSSLVRVERLDGVCDQGYAATTAQQAVGGAPHAAFRNHTKDNEFRIRIESRRTSGIQSRDQRVRTWIVEHVERVFLECDLLMRAYVCRESKAFFVGYFVGPFVGPFVGDDEPVRRACFGYEISTRSALQTVGRPLAKFQIVGGVCVCRRNQKDAALAGGFDQAIEIRNDFLGARNVESSAGKHEVGLRIHFPENRLRRDLVAPRSASPCRLDDRLPNLFAQLLETRTVANLERRGGCAQGQNVGGKPPAGGKKSLSGRYSRGAGLMRGRCQPSALAHHRHEQQLRPRKCFVFQADDVAGKGRLFALEAENLLAAGIGLLLLAELGGVAHLAGNLDFHQLIDDADEGRVGGGGERRADTKRVDARSAAQQGFDAVLLQVTGDENPHVAPPGAVESLPRPHAIGQDIAAIEAHAAGLAAERNDFFYGRAHVLR